MKKKFIYISIICIILILNFPIIYILLTSFKERADIITTPPKCLFSPTLDHYKTIFLGPTFPFWKYIITSLTVSFGSSLLSILLGLPAAYSISRYGTGGKNFPFWVLSIRMAPPIVFALPLFILMRTYGLIDTRAGLILSYLIFNIPLSVWVLRSFIREVPIEIEESARVDGCTVWGVLGRIVIPLIKPGLAAVFILNFIFSWNEFLFTLLLTSNRAVTLTVGTAKFITGYSVYWGDIAAATMSAAVPMIILGLVVEKHLVRGLTFGAVK